MAYNPNRLRFVHHDECFATVEDAKAYVVKQLEKIDRPSLYAEPMVLKYGDDKKPNILLGIGSVGDGVTPSVTNRTFFIDIASIENSIKAIEEELSGDVQTIKELQDLLKTVINSCGLLENGEYNVNEEDIILKVANSLNEADVYLSEYIQKLEKEYALSTENTNTVSLSLNKTKNGQTLSANVNTAEYKVVDNIQLPNIILAEESGLFTNVDLAYDKENNDLIFSVNGETKTFDLPTETYLISGRYDTKTESIILTLNTGVDISVDVRKLIGEWTVIGEFTDTPIILTLTPVKYEDTLHGADLYQDLLKADVRIATDEIKPFNILKKTDDGRSLYVDGTAKNIKYLKNGDFITVQEAIDTVETKISPSNDNIIYKRTDGIFADIELGYDSATNVLTFKRSNVNGGSDVFSYTLNSAKLLDDVSYDATREVVILRFTTADGKTSKIEIPVADIITEWDVDNTNNTVTLTRKRSVAGEDRLSANVNISTAEFNIVENNGHAIYVRGTADNIRYDEDYSVEGKIKAVNTELTQAIHNEETRAKEAEQNLSKSITDTNELLINEKTRALSAETALETSLNNEIKRALSAETLLNKSVENTNNALSREIERALNTENSISAQSLTNKENIASEISRAKEAEEVLRDSITKEISDRETAISELSHLLDDEIERANNVETSLNERVADNETLIEKISQDLVSEIQRAQKTETILTNNLASEITRAIEAEKDIKEIVDVNTENISETTTKVNTIREDLTNETNRALSAETALKNTIISETTRATTKENSISEKLENEIIRATTKENELQNLIEETNTNLNAEITRATEAEAILSNRIHDNSVNLSNETNRALSAETEINNTIQLVSGNVVTLVNNERTRALSAETEINNTIQSVSGNVVTLVNNERTRALSAETEINESIKNLSGATNALVDNERGRAENAEQTLEYLIKSVSGTIETEMDGINVSYDGASNTLTFVNSEGVTTNMKLTTTSLIDHLEYIQSTKTLRIYYKNSGEEGESKFVDIFIGDLFNQLEIDKTTSEAGAIRLELKVNQEVGNDILSASVRISTKDTNLLVNDNGVLYVSNQASDIKFEDGTNIVEKTTSIKTEISDEISRAKEAEEVLRDSITKEISDRETAISELSHLLDDEIERATQKEDTLNSNINSEIERAKGVEKEIKDNITDIDVRTDNLENGLKKEISDRELSETSINNSISSTNTALNAEIKNRENADVALTERINNIEGTTNTISTNILNEIDRAKKVENEIKHSIENETNRASSVETNLDYAILSANTNISILSGSNETNKQNIAQLSNRLSSVESSETELLYTIETVSGNVKNIITEESKRALSAETEINNTVKTVSGSIVTLINNEVNRAENKENEILNKVTANTKAINDEIIRAQGVENNLNNTINSVKTTLESEIIEAVKDAEIIPQETATVSFTKENTLLSANVKVSKTDKNILVTYEDGIYAKSSQLTYDSASNTLTFIDAKGIDKQIVLNSIDTIKNIYFDGTTDELVFQYTVEGSEKEVRIKAAAFFKGITGSDASASEGHNITVTTALTTNQDNTVTGITANLDVNDIIENNHSTVSLTKTDDNKVLASVNIATNVPYNILKVDGSNNSLFVNGEASNISATYKDAKTDVQTVISLIGEDFNKVNEDINDLQVKVASVSGQVKDNLIILDRHTEQITVLSGKLNTEIDERKSEITRLENRIIATENDITIINANIDAINHRIDGHDAAIKTINDRLDVIEKILEGNIIKVITDRLDSLDKKTDIVDDNYTDYLHQEFNWDKDGDGKTHVTTKLREDLARDPETGEGQDF